MIMPKNINTKTRAWNCKNLAMVATLALCDLQAICKRSANDMQAVCKRVTFSSMVKRISIGECHIYTMLAVLQSTFRFLNFPCLQYVSTISLVHFAFSRSASCFPAHCEHDFRVG